MSELSATLPLFEKPEPIAHENLAIHPSAKIKHILHGDKPIVEFVNNLLTQGIHQGASDIHIEPFEKFCRIRFRLQGLLSDFMEITHELAQRLNTRLKILGKLDISERRLPQDGRFQFTDENQCSIDFRINLCPVLHGEKIVLRILDARQDIFEIHSIGFTETEKQIFINKINQPQGLILVTGPTGSGKTITLYSALRSLNNTPKNILSAEDPIEIQLHGINQTNVNSKINLSFATLLRTFLRQDPDIIMIGEIRDEETAAIAFQAAQTGHLILSSLHTNSTFDTVARLKSLGIKTQQLTEVISLITAQRLVRKLCSSCKDPAALSRSLVTTLQKLSLTIPEKIFTPQGCNACLHGYQGRTAVYEFLPMTADFSALFAKSASQKTLRDTLASYGLSSLKQNAWRLVCNGITSINELERVIENEF